MKVAEAAYARALADYYRHGRKYGMTMGEYLIYALLPPNINDPEVLNTASDKEASELFYRRYVHE